MDIVPYPCPVQGGIVIAEYLQFRQFTHRHLGDIRYQVIRNISWIFTDHARRMRPHRVEIPEQCDIHSGVCLMQIPQDLLQHNLAPTVRIGGFQGEILCNGQ